MDIWDVLLHSSIVVAGKLESSVLLFEFGAPRHQADRGVGSNQLLQV